MSRLGVRHHLRVPTSPHATLRRSYRREAIFGTISVLATACLPSFTEFSTPAVGSPVTGIDGWHSRDARAEWVDTSLEAYATARKRAFKIRWTQFPDPVRLVQTLLVTLASGAAFPDLADIDQTVIGRILRLPDEPLLPLQSRLGSTPRDFVAESFTVPYTLRGKVFALGSELNVVMFAYRYDLWSQASIHGPLRTWEDVSEQGIKVRPISPDGMFFVRGDASGTHLTIATQAGAGYVGPGGRVQIDHPTNVQTLVRLAELVGRAGVASVLPRDRPGGLQLGGDPDGSVARAALNAGSVAGEIGAMWRLAGDLRTDAPNSAGRWMLQSLPLWTPARTRPFSVVNGGSGFAVIRRSTEAEALADFLMWLHTGASALTEFERHQVWPVNRKLYDDPRLTERVAWFHDQAIGPLLRDASSSVVACTYGVYWPEIARAISPGLRAVLNGQASASEALSEANIVARTLIAQAGGNPDGG